MLVHLCTLLLVTSVLSLPVRNKDLDAQFEEWKKRHEKVYSGPEEEAMRRAVWEKTLERVEAHNKEYAQGLHTYTQGMNQFSDITDEEWKSRRCLLPPDELDKPQPVLININDTMAVIGDMARNHTLVVLDGEVGGGQQQGRR